MTSRRPTSSALSTGTSMTSSLWWIWRVMYFLSTPLMVRVLTAVIVAAPWWGYTTVSPTSKIM